MSFRVIYRFKRSGSRGIKLFESYSDIVEWQHKMRDFIVIISWEEIEK